MGVYPSSESRDKYFVSWFFCCDAVCSLDCLCHDPETLHWVMESDVCHGQTQIIRRLTPKPIDRNMILPRSKTFKLRWDTFVTKNSSLPTTATSLGVNMMSLLALK